MTDIIAAKRDGGELTREQIEFFVRGVTDGSIPDYQSAALLMAVVWRGMNRRETLDLTLALKTNVLYFYKSYSNRLLLSCQRL